MDSGSAGVGIPSRACLGAGPRRRHRRLGGQRRAPHGDLPRRYRRLHPRLDVRHHGLHKRWLVTGLWLGSSKLFSPECTWRVALVYMAIGPSVPPAWPAHMQIRYNADQVQCRSGTMRMHTPVVAADLPACLLSQSTFGAHTASSPAGKSRCCTRSEATALPRGCQPAAVAAPAATWRWPRWLG